MSLPSSFKKAVERNKEQAKSISEGKKDTLRAAIQKARSSLQTKPRSPEWVFIPVQAWEGLVLAIDQLLRE